MTHKTVTQFRQNPMPRHSGLLCRQGRYYLNVRVPTDLRPLYGKQDIIRRSLKTSEYREAISRVRFENFRLESEFASKRRTLAAAKDATSAVLREISDQEAHELVYRFFITLEKTATGWWNDEGYRMGPREIEGVLDNLRVDETAYNGGGAAYLPADVSKELDGFLAEQEISIEKGSPAYRKLATLFRLAHLENIRRSQDRVAQKPVATREPVFREVFAHTPPPAARPSVTLGDMLSRFSKALVDAKRTEGTQRTYQIPARVLREVIGENTSLDAITRESIESLFELLRRAPANVVQKYPGLTLEQAIAKADNDKNGGRLGAKTLENYFNNIVAIFNFAVEKRLMSENPAKDRWLRASFSNGESRKPKVQFTNDELKTMFNAPLYTGCVDDEYSFLRKGENTPRRGRFWAPLIALFHGLRCNEVVQLYTEDIKEEDGIWFFEIREEREDGTRCDKRLKTKQSRRRVPIHSELLKMGILDFVTKRQHDNSHPRLFPELPCGATGYFSDPFSKWFGRFVTETLGDSCAASFQSFRHQFRDMLTEAGIPIPDVERLGGWEMMQRSAERLYGKGPSLRRLKEQIEKVDYVNLRLSHLYIK